MESLAEIDENRLVQQYSDEFKNVVFPVTIFVGIEIIIGFCGNLLVLFVFFFRYRLCNFRTFVLCLAFTDLISTLTTMPGEVLTQLKWYTYPDSLICKIKSCFNIFTLSAEMLCLLIIAVDRYRKVCQPFGWQITPRVASILCVTINIFAALISIPAFFLWGTRKLPKVYKNISITVTICEKDEYYAKTKHPFQYILSFYVFSVFFLSSTFIMYTFIVRKLTIHKRGNSRQVTQLLSRTSSSTGGNIWSNESPSNTVSTSEARQVSGILSSKKDAETKTISSKETLTSGGENKPVTLMFNPSQQVCKSIPKTDLGDTDNIRVRHNTSGNAKYKNSSSERSMMLDVKEHIANDPQVSVEIPEACHLRAAQKDKNPKLSSKLGTRLNTKTKIMLVLTIMFIITTVCYISLVGKIANDDVLQELSDTSRTVYFFFLRLYFINHVINPIVYGLLDPNFQKVLKQLICRRKC